MAGIRLIITHIFSWTPPRAGCYTEDMVIIGSREFSEDTLTRLSETIKIEPELSRRKLSRRVCEWMDWRNHEGRLQEMCCRKALLELERRKIIQLPKINKRYAFHEFKKPSEPPAIMELTCELRELGNIEIIHVTTRSQSRIWRSMLESYHYLGSGPLCGAQLRYLIRSEHYGWLGGLSYSACARRVESRDEWIGWTEESRKRNHRLVINNSRYLIAPMIKVKCLASHVLSRSQSRLVDDWEKVYNYRPVLVETYVERGRFAGTCYRASNWKYLGSTKGRGRQGKGAKVKDVYVMELEKNWQKELCRSADGKVKVSHAKQEKIPRDWIEEELGGAKLRDKRLTARLLQMTGMFYEKPLSNIPQACESVKAAKAAYRFLDNEYVDWKTILESHYEATEERVKEKRLVLVAQDTTALNYSSHPQTEGLGPIGTDSEKFRGLMVHDTMAFTEHGTPLGLLDVQCWSRTGIGSRKECDKKPIEQKESMKWLTSYRAVSQVQKRCRKKSMLVVMADREADIHEVFVEHHKTVAGAELLIRAEQSRNRKVIDDEERIEFLWSKLEKQAAIGTREILIPPNEKRSARQATLKVRTMPVMLYPPRTKKKLPTVKVWAVLAQEANPPSGVNGLEWMLLTTVEVKNDKDAYKRLEWYARRWGIECYHRIIKSGCRVESRQLENASRLRNALAIDMIIAWRIHYLTTLGHETPDVPCTVYFSESEWKALTTFTNKTKTPPDTPPSLNEAVSLLGKLGGHLGRNGDGHPGSEVLWRGMARLADIETAYELYAA